MSLDTNPLAQIQPIVSDPAEELSNKKWAKEEAVLVGWVTGTIEYYKRVHKKTIKVQRVLAVTTVVIGAVTPVIVAGAGTTGGLFHLDPGTLNSFAVVLTVALAILEGIRRIFRFEQRWISCHIAKVALQKSLGRFRFATVGLNPGSDEWKSAMLELRTSFESTTERESEVFYQNLKAFEPEDEKANKAK
jgi:hypothetical protein